MLGFCLSPGLCFHCCQKEGGEKISPGMFFCVFVKKKRVSHSISRNRPNISADILHQFHSTTPPHGEKVSRCKSSQGREHLHNSFRMPDLLVQLGQFLQKFDSFFSHWLEIELKQKTGVFFFLLASRSRRKWFGGPVYAFTAFPNKLAPLHSYSQLLHTPWKSGLLG